jgi:hypothetical protein
MIPNPPRIYFAGRMKEPCWRPFDIYDKVGFDEIPDERVILFRGEPIIYTGPFRTDLRRQTYCHRIQQTHVGAECRPN